MLLQRIADGTISNKIAKEVFAAMWEATSEQPTLADEIIEAKGLKQISDSGALEKIVDEVLAANAEIGRGIPRRQGKGVQRADRPGHEGDQGQGQPGAADRAAEEEAGLIRRANKKRPLAWPFFYVGCRFERAAGVAVNSR